MNRNDGMMDTGVRQSRRDFLKQSSGTLLSLSLSSLACAVAPGFVRSAVAGEQKIEYTVWEDIYRKIWKWDKVSWGSHANMCLPTNCSFHVYTKNGIVWREEQAAHMGRSDSKYPDYNPSGCQKGCSFSGLIYGNERVKYPLKRTGRRGEGKWKRIGWDEALTEIADAILDAHQTEGPESFVLDAPHAHAGAVSVTAGNRMNYMLGGTCPDVNVVIGDMCEGFILTVGKMGTGYTADNLFDAELIIFSHTNWSYTMTPLYHFITEARDNGTEVVVIAPDLNPSTPAADIHVPVKVGTDAAFWLGVCQVMIAEGLYDAAFVKEQTDLALLVRSDTRRYLRASDVEGGADNQLYFYDTRTSRIAPASRATLRFDGDQALEGAYRVRLQDGREVEVQPAFVVLKALLNGEYTPEKATQLCGVHPTVMREIARKMAKKRTCSYNGFNSAKFYHGDLMERALLLAHALSGNWGKPGSGYNSWAYASGGMFAFAEKTVANGGLEPMMQMAQMHAQQVLAADPTATDEIIEIGLKEQMTYLAGLYPPSFWLYYHAGYKDLWNNPSYQDPAMKRSFSGYLEEAIAKGWWTKRHLPLAPEKTPQVVLFFCANPLRRLRNGMTQYTEVLFPKVKMLFAIEPRMSSTAMYCDIVLPAAWYYEKTDLTGGFTISPSITFIDKAVEPIGEARPEWETFSLLMKKIGERAQARGMEGFTDRAGMFRRYEELYDRFTMGGQLHTQEEALKELITHNTTMGILPQGYSFERYKQEGSARIENIGPEAAATVANEYSPRKPFYSLRWHVEEKKVFPTYARRAQFYIDHEWFLELGEELPVHKEVPPIGGNHPFKLTGGHPRHSVHSTHLSNEPLLRMHRGQPIVHINNRTAAAHGIKDGDLVRMYNDVNNTELRCRLSPAVAPDQVIVYFWEAYQFRNWKVYDNMLVGQPKALHYAGGYDQVGRYYALNGSPSPTSDRGVRVNIVKVA